MTVILEEEEEKVAWSSREKKQASAKRGSSHTSLPPSSAVCWLLPSLLPLLPALLQHEPVDAPVVLPPSPPLLRLVTLPL